MTLLDFLTEKQIKQAYKLYLEHLSHTNAVGEIERQIIIPNMKEINHKLGQENNSKYLAYVCVYAFAKIEN